ncbi:hypothetical protein C479_09278 [Halovivax asiaticus JCM 14624]|uniref:DUF1616 domain-containing protein n=1 Tax=Halovivax asiaticus JCM 14624 TaxID=1227490 RepID=M0BJD6_9EURY|nr:DUF1616 domain-containing protein [Halovivax asiaticus]ELZ10991.1 hypothetical protein C479_09278 [Halovivax asiaticus JCM 14624]
MELRNLRGYLDLLVALSWVVLAAAVVAVSLHGIVRLVLLVPIVVFLPGYAVVSLSYPTAGSPTTESANGGSNAGLRARFARDNHAIGGVERIPLAIVWSLVVVPGIALGVHFSPSPIAAEPLQAGVFGVTAALLVAATVARARHPANERFVASLPRLPDRSSGFGSASSPLGTQASSTSHPGARLLLVVSLLVLASSVGYAFAASPHDERFTELSIQSGEVTNETTALYPSTLVDGQAADFEFAVGNHEGSSVEYEYVVALQHLDGSDAEPVVVDERAAERGEFELADGETRTVTADVTPETTGDDVRIVVLLYRDGAPADPSLENAYRSLRLPVDVTASDSVAASSARQAPGSDR